VVGREKFLIPTRCSEYAGCEIAKTIAKGRRFSNGGMRFVKGRDFWRGWRRFDDLTDFEQTPVHRGV